MMSNDIPFYWTRYAGEHGWHDPVNRPSGADLAALRSGLGRAPGTVPAMWRYHVYKITEGAAKSGFADVGYAAEHHALTLYAVHQQSIAHAMHRPRVGVGRAIKTLHGGSSQEDGRSQAIDRRFYAAVTAGSVDEVAHHLRGLIQMLRGLERPAPLDYSALVNDLRFWDHPEDRNRVRLRWGRQYEMRQTDDDDDAAILTTATTE